MPRIQHSPQPCTRCGTLYTPLRLPSLYCSTQCRNYACMARKTPGNYTPEHITELYQKTEKRLREYGKMLGKNLMENFESPAFSSKISPDQAVDITPDPTDSPSRSPLIERLTQEFSAYRNDIPRFFDSDGFILPQAARTLFWAQHEDRNEDTNVTVVSDWNVFYNEPWDAIPPGTTIEFPEDVAELNEPA